MAIAGIAAFLRRAFQKVLAFSTVFSLLLLLLYALGNYQRFLDSTQYLLLSLLNVSLWGVCLSGIYVLLFLVVTGAQERSFAWLRFLVTLFVLILAAALLLALQFLGAWFQG